MRPTLSLSPLLVISRPTEYCGERPAQLTSIVAVHESASGTKRTSVSKCYFDPLRLTGGTMRRREFITGLRPMERSDEQLAMDCSDRSYHRHSPAQFVGRPIATSEHANWSVGPGHCDVCSTQ